MPPTLRLPESVPSVPDIVVKVEALPTFRVPDNVSFVPFTSL